MSVNNLEADQSSKNSVVVEILSPKKGEVVHGQIQIEAKVNRPDLVKYIDFYIQDPGAKDRYGWKDYAPPYFWGGDGYAVDTTIFDDGSASVVAFCYSEDNKMIAQERVHFVIDNGKPFVKILSPVDGEIVEKNLMIKIDAIDVKGIAHKPGIKAVYLYLDGSLYQKSTKSSFKTLIDTCLFTEGLHALQVIVEDSEGAKTSKTIMFTIKKSPVSG